MSIGFAKRNGQEHIARAREYGQLQDQDSREKFFKIHSARYFELSRLPYFDPVRMTVLDPMHNILLGKVIWIFLSPWTNYSRRNIVRCRENSMVRCLG